jgi:YfiH family protein
MSRLPELDESFDWVEGAGGPALICRPLQDIARHLFTTRAWRLGSAPAGDADSWRDVAAALDVDLPRLIRVHQVHGAAVVVAREPSALQPDADIIVTREPQLALAVQAADCVPLLLADRRTGAVAAAHAGWRGLAARAPAAAVAALDSRRTSDVVAAIGPAIGSCCYEVGAEVRSQFAGGGFSPGELAEWFVDTPHDSRRNPSLRVAASFPAPNRWYFDTWAAARDQLATAGVPPEQIFVARLCTASHPETLCSYRRDGAVAGRIAGAIRSGPPRP